MRSARPVFGSLRRRECDPKILAAKLAWGRILLGVHRGVRLPAAEPPCNASHILDDIHLQFAQAARPTTTLEAHGLVVFV